MVDPFPVCFRKGTHTHTVPNAVNYPCKYMYIELVLTAAIVLSPRAHSCYITNKRPSGRQPLHKQGGGCLREAGKGLSPPLPGRYQPSHLDAGAY